MKVVYQINEPIPGTQLQPGDVIIIERRSDDVPSILAVREHCDKTMDLLASNPKSLTLVSFAGKPPRCASELPSWFRQRCSPPGRHLRVLE